MNTAITIITILAVVFTASDLIKALDHYYEVKFGITPTYTKGQIILAMALTVVVWAATIFLWFCYYDFRRDL